MRFFSNPIALLAALSVNGPVVAEQVQMPEQGATTYRGAPTMEIPVMGMSMEQVRQHFGEPVEVKSAVGDPPITRWVYDGYTVYFEYSYVIHSVRHR